MGVFDKDTRPLRLAHDKAKGLVDDDFDDDRAWTMKMYALVHPDESDRELEARFKRDIRRTVTGEKETLLIALLVRRKAEIHRLEDRVRHLELWVTQRGPACPKT